MKKVEGKVPSLKENEMIIRLGFGKGFNFTTVGDWIKNSLGFEGIVLWFETKDGIKKWLKGESFNKDRFSKKAKTRFSKKSILAIKKDVFSFPLTYWKTYNDIPLGWEN